MVSERKLGSIVPDIILFKGDRMLLVEIAVTHFVDEIKQHKIDELKIPVIEIDLGYLDRETVEEDLKEIVLTQTFNKVWKYNEKKDSFYQRAEKERDRREIEASEKQLRLDKERAEEQVKTERERAKKESYFLTKLRDVVIRVSKKARYGTVSQVHNCPLKKRMFNGEAYANVHADCFNCKYFRGFRENKTKIVCLNRGQ